jgi:YbbR domain-containing protein
VAERARNGTGRSVFPRARTFGTTAVTAGQQFNWIWSRESLLRLLLSLVLALALWLYISNKEDPRIVQDYPYPVPVSVSTTPEGMTVTNITTLEPVFLRFRRTDPNVPITSGSFRAIVDLAGLKPGLHRVPVQVITDPGIDVVGVRPTTIPVSIQRLQSKRVPVKVAVLSQPPAGYGSSISFSPSSATVSGPADLVSQVARATAYVDLGNLKSTIKQPYRLSPESASGTEVTGLTVSPPDVHVIASVHSFSSYKTLPVLVQFSGLPKQGFGVSGVTVDPAEIAASGSPGTLSKVSSVRTQAVSVNKRGGGSFKKTVRVNLPHGVHSRTRHVTITVQIAPIQSSTSVEIGIQPQGVTPGLVTHMLPGRVLVTVTGPSNTLHGVARTTHATVNLTGLAAGVYQLRPVVKSTQTRLHVETVYPQTVTVQLRPSS